MTTQMFRLWVSDLRQKLAIYNQRRLVVLCGDLTWSNKLVDDYLNDEDFYASSVNHRRIIAFGEQFCGKSSLIIKNYRHHLGTENDLVIFADDEFHPDAFAALSGTIKAGGIMFWLCSPDMINDKASLFISRFWQKVVNDENVLILRQENKKLPDFNITYTDNSLSEIGNFKHHNCITHDQLLAVEAIEKVANGHRKRPLVLTADRGRGKSSALAIAVANLFMSQQQSTKLKLLITAPHRDAVAVFFSQLDKTCDKGKCSGDYFTYKNHSVEFIPVDILVLDKPNAHLLLIDEAAAIPIYLLSNLLERYARVVFSSTVHGYEGAGRGFAINFKKILADKTPNFAQLHIHQPIRWSENDPLEQLIFSSFLLAPKLALLNDEKNLLSNYLPAKKEYMRQVSQKELVENESLLQEVFNVLVTAHYQTSPSDLKLLLSNQELTIFVSFASNHSTVLAVALALNESNASHTDIQLALASKKRLKNQFLPQSLLLHCGVKTAFEYKYLRIMRIAVQPELHGKGIGSDLLALIEDYALNNDYDFIGTSFGINKSLVNFWGKADYQFARIGFSKDKASGEHSCILLKALSSTADSKLLSINQQFYQRFNYYLSEQFQELNPELVQYIYQQVKPKILPKLSINDLIVVEDFVNKVSLYDACAFSLSIWLSNVISTKANRADKLPIELLIAKVLQRRSIADLCRQYQFTGKKALNNALVDQAKQLYLLTSNSSKLIE
ncbi:tRNA(Met) cytidine acetyltransferase TmcA [Thalassotalea profundi]|uniref:tRNA(Met) cytidine acetyltransferase TmcA n=1 Tax=Thalassotalea profundi TaxID=2036687 RepID=A0ABQ3IKJ5_9GAMM|nr:GNAT family N-acetyltransferase [Thalassotalea profundi]GHE87224.1 tRNA(Met) cytidine acetyltransferase TmcA [Thalassotalea profundi]